jgi:peptide/nickel transport system substrate-binding protein
MSSYWSNRVSRRRAIGTAGAGALGAAFLAACGGGSSDNKSDSGGTPKTTDKSGLIFEPTDNSAAAKPGGTVKTVYTADVLHFDALSSNSSSTVNDAAVFTYPRTLKFATTKYPKPHDGGVEGDVFESWEVSPDKLTYTAKVRQGMKWDPQAPTSGRAIDTRDILFSWDKFKKVNASAVNLAYDATKSPGAAIESVTAPDDKTIVLKLKQPDGALLTLLAGWDQWYIMPRESEGGFDPKTVVRGYGPFFLDDHRPSAYTHWKKNPDYYVKGRPYYDRLERALVPDFSTRLAQFKAGNIHTDVVEQTQDNVVQLKKDLPAALLILGSGGFGKNWSPTTSGNVYFGYEGNSIFKDVRMRQALSMAIDNEAFADVYENRANFAKDGLDNSVAWNSHLSPAWTGAYIDPHNEKEFGANAKYFKFDVAEAKKLVAAAGFNNAEFEFFHNSEQTYGAGYARQHQIYQAMFADIGLKPVMKGHPYATWLAQYHYGYIPSTYNAGQTKGFNGIGLGAERQRYTAVLSVHGLVHVEGDAFHGATADGRDAVKGDPKLNDMLGKLRQESDRNKVNEGMKEAQRYLAQQMYYIPKPSTSIPFTVWWPAIGNVGAYSSSVVGASRWAEQNLQWWLDTTKAPFVR